MHWSPQRLVVLAAIVILNSGCVSLDQNNLPKDQGTVPNASGGIITGSVTAPKAAHYHEEAYFWYRSLENPNDHKGVLTSGTLFPRFVLWLPSCSEDGLDDQCGRLFAINLTAGKYMIDQVVFGGNHYQLSTPAVFSVTEGETAYLGNLHVAFCVGLVRSTRGNILGADITIRDNYERDTSMVKAKFTALKTVTIKRSLLPGHAWKLRVPYKPHSWGNCSTTPDNSLNPTSGRLASAAG